MFELLLLTGCVLPRDDHRRKKLELATHCDDRIPFADHHHRHAFPWPLPYCLRWLCHTVT
jgi:hypothetical protein